MVLFIEEAQLDNIQSSLRYCQKSQGIWILMAFEVLVTILNLLKREGYILSGKVIQAEVFSSLLT